MNVRTSYMPCLALLALFILPRAACAQKEDTVPIAPSITMVRETYRLRVENDLYGRIEISVDEGRHYTLIGRVLHPATATLTDRTATDPNKVLRGSGFGLALVTNYGQTLKLRPSTPLPPAGKSNKRSTPPAPEPAAIITNLEPESGLFAAALLPPIGTPVSVQIEGHDPAPFPAEYTPAHDDTLTLQVRLPLPASPEGAAPMTEGERLSAFRVEIQKRVESLGQTYANGAIGRAEAEKRKIVSGTLTLKPKLPADEPDPITTVSFILDNDTTSTTNVAPYIYQWDTRNVSEGEHVIEIRGINQSAHTITRLRLLLVVRNSTEPPKQDKLD